MKDYISENFFFIDSNNIDNIESKLYGFCITKNDNEISLYNNINKEINGCYINVKKIDNDIYINTDDFSSLYIFYYIENDYFALSNSFYLLLENLKKNNKRVTINKSYIEQFIQSPLHSHSLFNTLINEILILPFGKNIKISNNNLEFVDKDINIQSINLLSEKGMSIINNWINKWTNIMKAILNSNYFTEIDLSGGYDSRVIFSLAYNTKVNLNNENIKIYSKIGTNKGMIHHLSDDYDIASKIANTLNIQLNQHQYNSKLNYYSSEEQYDLLKYTFLGLHKSGFNCVAKYVDPKFHFGGLNGEIIRGSLTNLSLKNIENRFSHNPVKNNENVINEFYNDIHSLDENEFKALTKFFINTQCRSHFGLSIYNSYIANLYTISPFNDADLLKLYVPEEFDKNIIFAIIIYKTCPEIFDIPFTNSSYFSDKTKEKAIEISNKYKLEFNDENLKLVDTEKLYKVKENNYDRKYGYDVSYKVFLDNKNLFINEMSKLFDEEYANKLYNYAHNFYLNKDNFMNNIFVNCLTSIIEVLKIIKD